MRELFVETRTAAGEDGANHKFDYFVVVDEMEVEGRLSCESYGIKVAEQGGDMAVVPNITVNIERIDALMELFLRNSVGPSAARDVVDDWL